MRFPQEVCGPNTPDKRGRPTSYPSARRKWPRMQTVQELLLIHKVGHNEYRRDQLLLLITL